MAKPIIKKGKKAPEVSYRINDEIKTYGKPVRVVGEGIEAKVVSLEEALEIADSKNLDLIEINSETSPIIVRVDDYDKFVFDKKKRLKKNKSKTSQLKEVQLSVTISENDINTKIKKAKEFIEDGDRVKVVLSMRGRELSRREENKKSIYKFITLMEDVAVAESLPKDEGNKTVVFLKKKKK